MKKEEFFDYLKENQKNIKITKVNPCCPFRIYFKVCDERYFIGEVVDQYDDTNVLILATLVDNERTIDDVLAETYWYSTTELTPCDYSGNKVTKRGVTYSKVNIERFIEQLELCFNEKSYWSEIQPKQEDISLEEQLKTMLYTKDVDIEINDANSIEQLIKLSMLYGALIGVDEANRLCWDNREESDDFYSKKVNRTVNIDNKVVDNVYNKYIHKLEKELKSVTKKVNKKGK